MPQGNSVDDPRAGNEFCKANGKRGKKGFS